MTGVRGARAYRDFTASAFGTLAAGFGGASARGLEMAPRSVSECITTLRDEAGAGTMHVG